MSTKVSRPARLVLRPEEKAKLRIRTNRLNRVSARALKHVRDLDGRVLFDFLHGKASEFELYNDNAVIGEPLNELMKLINRTKIDALENEILFELIVKCTYRCIFNEDCRIRILVLRILRCLTTTATRAIHLLQRNIDINLVRSLDIDENCESERLEALKFIARLLHLYDKSRVKTFFEVREESDIISENIEPLYLFPKCVLKSVISLALRHLPKFLEKRESKNADNLSYSALGILLETSASNPELVLECAGTDWIVRALIGAGASNAKLSNLVCRVLTKWLDSPVLREKAELHLVIEQIFAPLLDLGFFAQTGKDSIPGAPTKNSETLDACANVFLAILRSWAGVFACASTNEGNGIATSSPLNLLEYLGLGTVINSNLLKIRDLVIDICCEFVDLPYSSKKFTCWEDAVLFYSQMHLPDSYRCSLRDDFVVAEACSLVSSGMMFCDYVDLLASFRAAATFILINVGLPQSLVRLIMAKPDDPMSIKATLLLADVLRTGASFLPREWRLRIISVPTLIQSAAETFVTFSNIVHMVRSGLKPTSLNYTYSNSENALLLISRLDQLNNICLSRQNILDNLQNINYFVLAGLQSKRRLRSRSDSFQEETPDLNELIAASFYSDNTPIWHQVDRVLQILENDNRELLKRYKHSEKCHTFFANITAHFKPSAQKLISDPFDRLKIRCGCCAFTLISSLLAEPYYSQMMGDFITNFREQLEPNALHSGVFASKYLNSGAMYYFSLIGAICSNNDGYEFLERMRIFQLFLDLITSQSSIEYVKLVLSCLDYNKNGLSRLILETALTTTDEPSRKWATRFLEVLAVLQNVDDFADFGMGLLFRQLTDESPKVVRHAVRLLNTWIPKYPQSLKFVKNIPVASLGEVGILLKTHLYEDEHYVMENRHEALKTLQLWMETFNVRYVETIEESMRLALLNVRRSLNGRFARSSSEKYERYGVPAPVHLLANLAKHATGRQILLQTRVVPELLSVLKNATLNAKNYERIKAALFGLAHIAGNLPKKHEEQKLIPMETIPIICRFAEECPVLSIRGTAFWATNIIGGSEFGSRALATMGWESNRYTEVLDEIRLRMENLDTNALRPNDISNIRSLKNPSLGFKTSSIEGADNPPRAHSQLERLHSDSLYPLPRIKELTRRNLEVVLGNAVRPERTFTQESAVTSGFGSAPNDEPIEAVAQMTNIDPILLDVPTKSRQNSILNNPLASTSTEMPVKLDEWENFSNSRVFATEQNVLRYEVSFKDTGRIYVNKQKLINKNKAHFSSAYRKKFGAISFDYPRVLTISRTIDSDINYSFLTDEERDSLCAYRQFLSATGDQQCSITVTPSGPVTTPPSNWTYIALPCRVELMCQKIFVKPSKNSKFKKFEKSSRFNVVSTHIKIRCFYCSRAMVQKVDPLPSDVVQEYKNRRSEVLQMISMLEIRGGSLETHLSKLYKESKIFEHPCMYADVLEMMAEFNYSVESRKLLHKLFWKAFRPP